MQKALIKCGMKKFLFLLGSMLFCACFLIACSYSLASKVKNHISELSQILFAADGQTFFATLTGGEREEPYIHDGQTATKQPFSVLCVTFFESIKDDTIPVVLTINNQTFQGELERNPFNTNYMTDFEKILLPEDQITLQIGETTVEFECKSNSFETDSQKAIDIAIENLNDQLMEQFSNNSFNAECYLKIINNPFQNKNVYYWFFTVRTADKTIGTIVIDTMSNNVLARY